MDHYFWSENLSESIASADVVHLPENTSDHCPIFCKIDVNRLPTISKASQEESPPNVCWKKATEDQRQNYTETMEQRLKNIKVPDCVNECCDVNCGLECHQDGIDDFLVNILRSIKSTADDCLPRMKKKTVREKKNPIACWHEDIQPYKEKSMFWHSIWISAGRPINTELHRLMKKTRNIYHLQIRKNKKLAEKLKKNAFLKACIDDNEDIFKLIKKERRTMISLPTTMDGVSINIENHFSGIYKRLYNSVDDKSDLENFKKQLSRRIIASSIEDVYDITTDRVQEALYRLKTNKTDPILAFNSDCLKNSPRILCEYLSFMFRQFLIHGHISSFLMISTLVPLVKDKLGDITSSDNYRSIAISSLILKVFDYVILDIHGDKLTTDELQFGYQENTSTSMCTWLVVETVEYYLRHGSNIYACVMDMTKAFDNVKHSTLFRKLDEKGIPPIVLRLLVKMYDTQEANVRWNNNLSDTFSLRNGVKQGAVLSPRLFCVYTDALFSALRRRRTGCWMGDAFVGIVGYADDLLLLSPTMDGLQEMVSSCEQFANDHNLKFSTHDNLKKCKTKCIAFSLGKGKENLVNINLNGKVLPWVESAKHLGCKLTEDLHGLSKDTMEKRAQYINRVNELNQEFFFVHCSTRIMINNIFNTSFYGSQLWDLFSKEATRVEKTWNISQRTILRLPRSSHRYFIEPLSNTRHITFSLIKRFTNFIQKVADSSKYVLRRVLAAVKDDSRSTSGNNLRKIMLMVGKNAAEPVTHKDLKTLTYAPVPHNQEWKIQLAREILEIKNGKLEMKLLDYKDLDEVLKVVTT